MKKLYYLFLLLPFSLLFSCSDDKDFSPVDMTLTLDGVTLVNDNFYTISGENVSVENLEVKSIDGKNSAVTNVLFTLNGMPLNGVPGNPFVGTISTENLKAGTYSLEISGNLIQVDSSIKIFAVSYPLTIVESEENLPTGAPEIGSYSQTIRLTDSK
ncbi:MAG: hypothetical protein J1E16_09160 [Muribaculaceae bacterium]|nr:hypothetical protein [Muribaculaceae bacterium]